MHIATAEMKTKAAMIHSRMVVWSPMAVSRSDPFGGSTGLTDGVAISLLAGFDRRRNLVALFCDNAPSLFEDVACRIAKLLAAAAQVVLAFVRLGQDQITSLGAALGCE